MSESKFLKCIYFVVFLALVLCPLTIYGEPTDNGVQWLRDTQNVDGSWATPPTDFTDTCEVANTLHYLGLADATYSVAVNWVSAKTPVNIDELARQIEVPAHTGIDVSTWVAELLSYQNTDGSWGVAEGYSGDALDTLVSFRALEVSDNLDDITTPKIIGWFLNNQNPDGGWGYTKDTESNIYLTSLVLMTLSSYQTTYNIAANVDMATSWLLAQQNIDGGFGASVFETALVYSALVRTAFAPAQTQDALTYLQSAQAPNGSWNDNAFETALALRALSEAKPNLSISSADIVFNPAKPYEGDIVKMTATIRNPSAVTIENVAVRFYLGPPIENIQIGAEQVISQIPAGGVGIAEVNWNSSGYSGLNDIYVVIDPDNTILELNEADNEAHRTITTLIKTVQLVDLVVSPEHIYFNPANPTDGDLVTITGFVGNQGQTDLNNVEVAFYNGEPGSGGEQIGSIQLIGKIVSGTYGQAQVTWDTTGKSGSHTIYLVADPENKISEGDETNNTASKSITVAAVVNLPDLAITKIATYQVDNDILITATIANKGLVEANNILVKFYNGDPEKAAPQIGEAQIATLAAEATGEAQITWTPAPGEYNIYIVADPDNSIAEGNELNNTGILKLTIGIAKDLSISSEYIYFNPETPTEGEAVTILANIGNSGGTTFKSVEVAFYEDSITPANQIGTTQIIQSISPGTYGEIQVSWDTTGKAGGHTIYVVADPENKIAEDDETNNSVSKSITVTEAVNLPDLTITNLTSSQVDSNILITATISNKGLLGADNILVSFYDGDPAKEGVQIDGDQSITTLAAGEDGKVQVTWIPTPGEHSIYVVADPANTITESNELNNTGIIKITIISVVDLVAVQISCNPESPTEGDIVTITGYVGNQGSKDAADVEAAFYDGDPASGGVQIETTQTISSLGAGSVQSVNVAWETTGKKGTHTIYLVVDPNNTISEGDETNNTVSKSITVVEKVALPDFAITGMSFSNDWPNVDEQITITAEITNKGLVPASNIVVRFYDGEPQTGVAIGDATISSLDSGATSSASVTWMATPSGEHKIYVVADPDNAIPEGNELNNSGYAEIRVGILPDFSISSDDITFSHTDLTQGLKVIISAMISNIGLASANTLVNLYDGENLIGQVVSDILPPSATQIINIDWYPEAGTHTVTLKLDPANLIPEIDETNNSTSKSVEITIPGTIVKIYKVTNTEKIETDQFNAYEQLEVVVVHKWTDALIFMEVLDAQGNSYYPPVPFLEGTATTRYWYAMNRPPGHYTLTVYIVDACTGYLIEAKEVSFTILPVFELKKLEAKVNPTFTYGGTLQTITIFAGLTNASNIPADLKIIYAMTTPTGTEVPEGSGEELLTLTLEQENPVLQLAKFEYQFTEVGDYTIQIKILKDEQELLSDQAILTVLPDIRVEINKTISPENIFPGEDREITTEIEIKGVDATGE